MLKFASDLPFKRIRNMPGEFWLKEAGRSDPIGAISLSQVVVIILRQKRNWRILKTILKTYIKEFTILFRSGIFCYEKMDF